MPSLPDGRKFAYTPEGMAKYKQEAAKLLPTEESTVASRMADTGAGALKGATIGSKFGPIGTGVGALVGGTAGLLGVDPEALPKNLPTMGSKRNKAAKLIDGEVDPEELTEAERKLRDFKFSDMSG